MKNLYPCIALFFIVFKSFAAERLNTDTTKTSLTLATVYSSNANYYGQTAAEKLPYVLSNATLRLKSGFFVSAGAYKLLNSSAGISEADLGAGYDFNITKNLSGVLSYTYSFFPSGSPLLQAANQNTASGLLSYDWKWFNTDLSTDYAFGREQDLFVSLSNSKLLDLGSLFSKKDYLSLEPSFEIVGGTQHFFETYTTQKTSRDKLKGIIPLFPPKQNTTTTTVSSTSFDLLSYNLKLPLAYNRTHYTVETTYQFSVLSNKVTEVSNKPRSFFNLSFYYLF